MNKNIELFKHVYIDNKAEKTLVLLHGTGGDEHNLLFFDDVLGKKYNLLGLRGNIDEDGMTRFFRRFEAGVFDQENIKEETLKLHKFMNAWMRNTSTSIDDLSYLGYSNGANMILATMFYYPESIKTATLLHGMLPFLPKQSLELSGQRVFVSFGLYDEMIPVVESLKMVKILQSLDTKLSVHEYASGHEVLREEIDDVVEFLRK